MASGPIGTTWDANSWDSTAWDDDSWGAEAAAASSGSSAPYHYKYRTVGYRLIGSIILILLIG